MMDIYKRIMALPTGYCVVVYNSRKYGVSRQNFNGGKSIKVYAEELGGKHVISFNYYATSQTGNLKPCEMPVADVLHFLEHYVVQQDG